MLSTSEKYSWIIPVMEIATEMQRISWLGKKNGQEPVLLLDIRIPSISVTGAENLNRNGGVSKTAFSSPTNLHLTFCLGNILEFWVTCTYYY